VHWGCGLRRCFKVRNSNLEIRNKFEIRREKCSRLGCEALIFWLQSFIKTEAVLKI
jgi:hypothetical protein